MTTRIYTVASARLQELIQKELQTACGHLQPRRIVLKPNWVIHESDPAFPIRALVTDARIIEATAEACLKLFPQAQSILIGDCPLQYAHWPRLCEQSGIAGVIERLEKKSCGKVVIRDLRKEVFQRTNGNFLAVSEGEHGDPAGYRV